MFSHKLFATLTFVAAAPAALAVPVVFTSTAHGVVYSNSARDFSDITAGSTFELTTVATYESDWIGSDWLHREGTVADTLTLTLKSGDKTYVLDNQFMYASMTTSTAAWDGTGTMTFGIDLIGTKGYRIEQNVTSPDSSYQAPLLFAPGTNVSFTAPFKQSIYIGTTESTEPIGYMTMTAELTRYTVTAVPEPTTYAMMMGGLLLVGLVARRRRQIG